MIRSSSPLFNPFSDRTIEGIMAWAHSKGTAPDTSSTSKSYGVRIDLWKKTEEERASQLEAPLSSQQSQESFEEGYKNGVAEEREKSAAAYKKGVAEERKKGFYFGYAKGYQKGVSNTIEKANQKANQTLEKLFHEFVKEFSKLHVLNTQVDASLSTLERKLFERISKSHQFTEDLMTNFQSDLSESVAKLSHFTQDLVKYHHKKEMAFKCKISYARGYSKGIFVGAVSALAAALFIKMSFWLITKHN